MKEINYSFDISNSIITVDAPDGSGKSTFSKVLVDYLNNQYKKIEVVLVKPTTFKQSPEALRFGERLASRKNMADNSAQHNLYFLCALTQNYRHVILPAIRSGKIVVTDSSEIRSLAYILDRGDEKAIASTYKHIDNGLLTNNVLPGNRIILKTSPEDCLNNIKNRNKQDIGDPIDINEMKKRHQCYGESINYMMQLAPSSSVSWIFTENKPYGKELLLAHLNKLICDKIVPQLNGIN